MAEQKLESEVAKQLDLNVIRYSRVVEDHRVLSRGLQIKKDQDVVMCITSSGDNVLNLLLDCPKKMLAIDMSHAQNSLLEIKLAAIQHLDYQDYLYLLGEKDGDNPHTRLDLYQHIRAFLPTYAQEFWDSRQDVIKEGMCEQSRLQHHIKRMNGVLDKSVDPDKMDEFMAANSLAEQNALFEKLPLDKLKEVQVHFFKKSTQAEGRSEAQLKYVEKSDEEVTRGIWERLYSVCTKLPIKDNFYVSWWLRGPRGFDPENNPTMAPPFLTREGFTKLKGLVDRVKVLTCSIEEYMSRSDTPVDKIALSDIFEYMSEEAAETIFTSLARLVAPGGRVAFWNLFNHRMPSKSLMQGKMTYLEELSDQLHQVDRAFFYSAFRVVLVN